jgi:hypothetical protein
MQHGGQPAAPALALRIARPEPFRAIAVVEPDPSQYVSGRHPAPKCCGWARETCWGVVAIGSVARIAASPAPEVAKVDAM